MPIHTYTPHKSHKHWKILIYDVTVSDFGYVLFTCMDVGMSLRMPWLPYQHSYWFLQHKYTAVWMCGLWLPISYSCGEPGGTLPYSKNTSGRIPNGIVWWKATGFLHSTDLPLSLFTLSPHLVVSSIQFCMPLSPSPSRSVSPCPVFISTHPCPFICPLYLLANVLGKQRRLYVCHGGCNIWSHRHRACPITPYISSQKCIYFALAVSLQANQAR